MTAQPVGMTDAEAVTALAGMMQEEIQPEDDSPQEVQPEEVTAEESSEVEVVADAPEPEEVEALEEGDEVEAPEDVQSEEQAIRNDADLAEAMGMSLDELKGSLKIRIKVDGEEREVPLGEVVKGYQLDEYTTKQQQAVAEERKQVRAEAAKMHEEYVQRHQALAGQYTAEEQALVQEYNSINWQELRQIDPAEFAAQQAEFKLRQDNIAQKRNYGVQQWSEYQQQLESANAKFVEEEKVALADMAGWSHAETHDRMMEIAMFMHKEFDIPGEALLSIRDRNTFMAMRELMQYRRKDAELAGAAETAKAKTTKRRVKRVLKPGSRNLGQAPSNSRYNELAKKAKKTQSDDDWSTALMEKLNL